MGPGEMHTGFWWGNLEGRRPLGRPKLKLKDIIRMDLHEVAWEGYRLDRSGSGQGKVACCCECSNEPSVSIKFGEYFD